MMTYQELEEEIKNQYKGHETECTLKDFAESLPNEGVAEGHSYFAYLFDDDKLAHSDYWGLSEEQQEYWDGFLDQLKDYTYDLYFDDDNSSNNEGWSATYQECLDYIHCNNGTNESYFGDYKGGVVSIYCNETDEVMYQERIR